MSGTNTQISQHVETHTTSCQWSMGLDSALSQLVKIQELDNGQTGETSGVDWFSQQLNMTLRADNGIVLREIMQQLRLLLEILLSSLHFLQLSAFLLIFYEMPIFYSAKSKKLQIVFSALLLRVLRASFVLPSLF